MELQNLWNKQDWQQSELSFDSEVLDKEMEAKVIRRLKKIMGFYYRSLLFNLAFLLVVYTIYFVQPKPDLLIPVGIISSVFIFIIIKLSGYIWQSSFYDRALSLKVVLQETLKRENKLSRQMCSYNSWLLTASFLGGLLLGFFLQGKSVAYLIDRPLILMVLLLLTVCFYILTKTIIFQQINRLLAPGYYKNREFLQKQLQQLEEEEVK